MGQAACEIVEDGGVPQAFNSVKISVKNAGSEFIRSILCDKEFTISKHRSQKRSFESSTRKGFSGYDISFPMYEYDKYKHVNTTACNSGSLSTSSPLTNSLTSM